MVCQASTTLCLGMCNIDNIAVVPASHRDHIHNRRNHDDMAKTLLSRPQFSERYPVDKHHALHALDSVSLRGYLYAIGQLSLPYTLQPGISIRVESGSGC